MSSATNYTTTLEMAELNNPGTGTAGQGYYSSAQQSLRLRRLSSRAPNQSAAGAAGAVFDWGSSSEAGREGEEEEEEEEPRNLRELAMPLYMKRKVREVQKMRIPVSSGRVRRSRALRLCCAEVKSVFNMVTLWRAAINKIGGHFGGGVQSYFVFLRFLVVLNFLSFLLIAGFVVIPSIVFRAQGFNTSLSMLPDNANITGLETCMVYDPNPGALTVFYTYFLDLLSGTGFMEYSYMFYGYYNNTQVVVDESFSYNIPLAYLLTVSFYFLFCLVCIILRMGGVWRDAVATGGGTAGGYSMMVFTGWDYGLQGSRAIKLKQNNIHFQLQVDLEEERIKRRAQALTLAQLVGLYALRGFLNLVVIGIILAAFVAIGKATSFSQTESERWDGIVGLLLEFLPSIVITAANFVVPFLCDIIGQLEKHSPSTTIILALLRAVILRLVSLGVLLYSLWSNITCNNPDPEDKTTTCEPCSYNYNLYQCWETRVGQEMYKLTLFDFLTTIALLVLVEFPRRMVVDHCSNKLIQWVGRQEFLVPPNVLGLVYAQTVVWTGALFCPLLPLVNTIKFVIIFYCKKITLFHNCRPAAKVFRSTSSNIVFFLVLLFGWMLASMVLIYSMAEIHPSYGCGPFRFSSSMWRTIPDTFQNLPATAKDFLIFIGSQAFSVPLFIASCVLLCYVAALASVYGKSVALLKAQLQLEGRDKQFLVKQIDELQRKLKPKEDPLDASTSTLSQVQALWNTQAS